MDYGALEAFEERAAELLSALEKASNNSQVRVPSTSASSTEHELGHDLATSSPRAHTIRS